MRHVNTLIRRHTSNKLFNFTSLRRFKSYATSGLSYYQNPGKESLRAVTIGAILDEIVEKYPDRRAIVSMHQGQTLTFSELRKKANQLGASLLKLGLKPGEKVAMLGPNSVEWVITNLAAAKAGLIGVTINPAYMADELKYSLEKVKVKALIVTSEIFKTQDYYNIITEIDPSITKIPSGSKITSSVLPELEYLIICTEKDKPGVCKFNDVFIAANNDNELNDIALKIQPDDPVAIQYSSGTTGLPKATTLTHFGLVNNAYFFGKRYEFHKKHQTLCLQVPLFHTFGASVGLLNCINFGMTTVLPGPSFKPENTLEAIKKEIVTVIYGTPTMYSDLLLSINNEKDEKNIEQIQKGLSSINTIVSGGAVCSPKLFTDIANTFKCTNICSAFGMTEASPIVCSSTSKDTFEQRTTTVGKVAAHTEVKIVDNEGRMVPFGTAGEAWYRGYSIMLNYWGDEEKTKEIMTTCRWLKSGDLMVLNSDGYGQIVGRIKDVIIRGGENIYPSEVENFLQHHPDISEAYLFGINDERLGEEVCASIKLKSGAKITEQQIKEFCKGKIAHYKIPRYIEFVEDFPKTASGKIKKFILRQELEKKLGIFKN